MAPISARRAAASSAERPRPELPGADSTCCRSSDGTPATIRRCRTRPANSMTPSADMGPRCCKGRKKVPNGPPACLAAGGARPGAKVTPRCAVRPCPAGLIFGRNVFQRGHDESLRFVTQLEEILAKYPS